MGFQDLEVRLYQNSSGGFVAAGHSYRRWPQFLSLVCNHDPCWNGLESAPPMVVLPVNRSGLVKIVCAIRSAFEGVRPRVASGGRLGLLDAETNKIVAEASSWRRLTELTGYHHKKLYDSMVGRRWIESRLFVIGLSTPEDSL